MQKTTLLFFAFIAIAGTVTSQNPRHEALAAQIDSMTAEDQHYRSLLRDARNQPVRNEQNIQKCVEHVQWIDSLNLLKAKAIFAEFGYPGIDLVGKESSHHFWLLAQHCDADPDFQEKMLDAMYDQVTKKNADAKDYAYLRDRVSVNRGQLQTYGTQMQINADSTSFEPKPMVEPEKIDARRQEMGLGTMENYIFTMNQVYHGVLKKKGE
ncbi:MAG: hypothetical protein JNJ90_02340 [Saprospiraceae bacterium]|jgi:hypothetical protein|nr:hypothetical protein [Saprospiraceae bacterium]